MATSEDPAVRPQGMPPLAPTPAPAAVGDGGNGLTIAGWILAGIGGLLLAAGIALVVVHLTQRNSDGYYTSSAIPVAAPGYAVTSKALHIGDFPSGASDVVGRVRVTASSNSGRTLFVGIAPQGAVNGYLAGVARSDVNDVNDNRVTSYTSHAGGAPTAIPARQSFWESANTGSGEVSVTWTVPGGNWSS